MTSAHRTLLSWVFTTLGLLGGLQATYTHFNETDFPLDMLIYLKGVEAYLSGGDMYSEPMVVGDLALPFIYPPFGALFLAPFWWLGIEGDAAGNLINLISNLLILPCLFLLIRVLLPQASREIQLPLSAITWALVLSFEPIDLNNSFGQINIVLMALIVLDMAPRKRWLPQGWLLGIASAIKLSPLAMGLYYLLRKDLRALLAAGAAGLAATGVAALWNSGATTQFFGSTLAGLNSPVGAGVNTTYQSNSSLKGMLMRWAPSAEWLEAHHSAVNIAWMVCSLAVIIGGGWLMLALMRRGMNIDAMGINALIMLLISPISWSHHWVWLALILPIFAWRCLTLLKRPWLLGSLTALWTYLVITEPPKWWYDEKIEATSTFALTLWEKILISDYVWLALASMIALAIGLRGTTSAAVRKAEGFAATPPTGEN